MTSDKEEVVAALGAGCLSCIALLAIAVIVFGCLGLFGLGIVKAFELF